MASLPPRSAAGTGPATLSLAAMLIAASATLAAPSMVWMSCLLGWWLLVLAAIDFRLFILPDPLTLGLALCGVGATAVMAPDRLAASAIGAIAGFAILGLVRETYLRIRGRDGLGLGDAKLLAALGAWLGWQALPAVILLAALGGLLAILAGRMLGRPIRADQAIPFGPFLAAGGWLVWLHGGLTLG